MGSKEGCKRENWGDLKSGYLVSLKWTSLRLETILLLRKLICFLFDPCLLTQLSAVVAGKWAYSDVRVPVNSTISCIATVHQCRTHSAYE